jgi:hypothetical protein
VCRQSIFISGFPTWLPSAKANLLSIFLKHIILLGLVYTNEDEQRLVRADWLLANSPFFISPEAYPPANSSTKSNQRSLSLKTKPDKPDVKR